MTGVPPTDSIIADSTASSSSPPRPSVDSGTYNTSQSNAPTVPSAQVKRVGRTYGRPKPDVAIPEVLREDSESRARILKTAPCDADDQVIPESDDANEHIPSFDGSDWRAKLKAIDEGLIEFGDMGETRQAINTSTTQTYDASVASQGVGEALQPPSESPLSSLSQLSLAGPDEGAHSAASTSVIETDTLFSASTLSSLLPMGSPSSGTSTLFPNVKLGESITLSKPSRPSHNRSKSSDDSDSENASPQHPFPISTPKHRSTPTPPTSPLTGESVPHVETTSEEESANSTARAGKKGRPFVKGKVKDKGKGKEKRIKAPTKKEVLELRKESARLLADQRVTIRRTQTHSTHTIASLFNKLKGTPIQARQDSDPITSFSSPGNVFKTSCDAPLSDEESPVKLVSSSLRSTKVNLRPTPVPSPGPDNVGPAPSQDDSDEDLPDPGALLRDSEEKRLRQNQQEPERATAKKKAKELEERKRNVLKTQKLQSGGSTSLKAGAEDSDTDDLEVEYVVGPPAPGTREGKGMKLSLGSKIPKSFGERGKKRGSISGSHLVSQKSLEWAARPAFMTDRGKTGKKGKKGHDTSVSHQDLNDLILQRANKQSGAIEEMKKEQWVNAGGIYKDQGRGDAQETSVTDWLHKGASREDAMDVDEPDDSDEDGDDPEYTPQDAGEQGSNDSDEEVDDVEVTNSREAVLERSIDVPEELDVDTDKENHRPAPRRQSARTIVDSDEEDEAASGRRPITREPIVLVPDTSFTLDGGAEDSLGEDKENSAELAFDVSDDKENARVPRHLPRGRSFLGGSDVQGDDGRSTSPPAGDDAMSSREPLGSLHDEGLGGTALMPPPLAQRRDASQDRVLQVLHEEDKDATLAPVTSTRKGILHRGYASSSPGSDDVNVESLQPIAPTGFSQLFLEGGDSPESKEPDPASALGEGGFSQFFSQGRTQGDIFDGSPVHTKRSNFFAHRSGSAALEEDGFEFTQPNALLPSVRISESQKREIDEMFGKDQEFKLDEARKSREQAKAGHSSALGPPTFGSFAPSQPTQPSPHSIRRPLETLTLTSTAQLDSSPGDQPLRRGRLLRERPQGREMPPASPSPSRRPRNAFDVLRDAAKSKGKKRYPKQGLERSEFVEAEAQESDEEAMLGFGGAKGDDEEEIGDEDPDAVVEGLVNDAAMDVSVQAADLVLEKHMEHQAADDAALTKLHQDAVDGKLRGKRRDRGIGFEDSDSEDELRGARKPLNKKRKIEGDTLDAYGENPETRPFYNAYQADLAEEDDPTLAYLQQAVSVHMQEMEEDDSSEEHIPEEVAPAEIRRRIRELAASERSLSPNLDPNNVGWIDRDSEDLEMQDTSIEVRRIHTKKPTTTNHSLLDHVDFRGSFKQKNVDVKEQARLKSWATQEARTHASASGRGGFSRKEEVGASSRKPGKGPIATTSQNVDAQTLTKSSTSSLLSRVEKRKGFDS